MNQNKHGSGKQNFTNIQCHRLKPAGTRNDQNKFQICKTPERNFQVCGNSKSGGGRILCAGSLIS